MSRLSRFEYGGALYHVLPWGNERRNSVVESKDRFCFRARQVKCRSASSLIFAPIC